MSNLKIPWARDVDVQLPGQGTVYLRKDWVEARIFLSGNITITVNIPILLNSFLEPDPVETENLANYLDECMENRSGTNPAGKWDLLNCTQSWIIGDPVTLRMERSHAQGTPRTGRWRLTVQDKIHDSYGSFPWEFSQEFWIYRFTTPDDDGLVVLRGAVRDGWPRVHATEIWRGPAGQVSEFIRQLWHPRKALGKMGRSYYNEFFDNGFLWAYELNEQLTSRPGGNKSPDVQWAYAAIAENPDLIWPDFAERLISRKPSDLHPALRSALEIWKFWHRGNENA